MIISRTPYRISFFGGGTDYHTWYQEHGGAVLSTAIDHYCYINARFLLPFFKEKSRIVWSKIESVEENREIEHPSIRAVLEYLKIDRGVEIHHIGDLPARSGLGSSSSFTVGMLHAMHALLNNMSNKHQLASEAIHVEREILRENVGVQDQIAAAYGGFNKIIIKPSGDFAVEPVIISQERLQELQSHFLMFFTGVSRTASTIAEEQIKSAHNKKAELGAMRELVDEALKVVIGQGDIAEFGRLLDQTWQIKRKLASGIAPGFVDAVYARARAAGAIGGKLLGAGGGGFMLFFARPEDHLRLKQALDDLLYVPFKFEPNGSSIIFCEPQNYTNYAFTRRDFYHLRDQNIEASSSMLSDDDNVVISLCKP